MRFAFVPFAPALPQRRLLLLDGGAQRGNFGSRGVERHLDGGAFPALPTERHLRVRRAPERRGEFSLDLPTRASSVLLGGARLCRREFGVFAVRAVRLALLFLELQSSQQLGLARGGFGA